MAPLRKIADLLASAPTDPEAHLWGPDAGAALRPDARCFVPAVVVLETRKDRSL